MINWGQIGDRVYVILQSFQENQAKMKAAAKERGVTVNQMAAASITGMIREALDKDGPPKGKR